MSKTIQQIVLIVIVIALAAVGAIGLLMVQKMGLEKQNQYLQGQVSESETKEHSLTQQVKKLTDEALTLRKDIDQKTRDIETAKNKADDIRRESSRISDDLARAQRDKSDIESRMASIRRERDDLVEKLRNRPAEEKVVEKTVYLDSNGRALPPEYKPGSPIAVPGLQPAADSSETAQAPAPLPATNVVIQNNANEAYWAGVARQKAALEIELAEAKKKLGESQIKIEELKKGNSDLEIELGRLKNERDDIVRKIKYGEDLADSLSIELARARNDQRVIEDRSEKVNEENQGLRTQIKDLSSTKVALEKSISRLTDDKASIEKKLVETENIIQGRIDEIWKIKKDVDNRFDVHKSMNGEVELAPIVVNASVAPAKSAPVNAPRRNGSVVSVNDENNFVVIDLGENDGIRVGDTFKVYRGKDSLGVVSVIQVRKDISAADIKQKTVPFKAGDQVR